MQQYTSSDNIKLIANKISAEYKIGLDVQSNLLIIRLQNGHTCIMEEYLINQGQSYNKVHLKSSLLVKKKANFSLKIELNNIVESFLSIFTKKTFLGDKEYVLKQKPMIILPNEANNFSISFTKIKPFLLTTQDIPRKYIFDEVGYGKKRIDTSNYATINIYFDYQFPKNTEFYIELKRIYNNVLKSLLKQSIIEYIDI